MRRRRVHDSSILLLQQCAHGSVDRLFGFRLLRPKAIKKAALRHLHFIAHPLVCKIDYSAKLSSVIVSLGIGLQHSLQRLDTVSYRGFATRFLAHFVEEAIGVPLSFD